MERITPKEYQRIGEAETQMREYLKSSPTKVWPRAPWPGTGVEIPKRPSNPKDLVGSKKVSVSKFPMTAMIHGAHAMMNGAEKYGPYNWRANDVIASIYVDAATRHLAAWFEREETAEDSGVHHLGHALASIAILIDAQENGNLIDDRPSAKSLEVIKNLLDRLSNVIANRQKTSSEEKK